MWCTYACILYKQGMQQKVKNKSVRIKNNVIGVLVFETIVTKNLKAWKPDEYYGYKYNRKKCR